MDHTKPLALQLLYSHPKPGRLEAVLPRIRYRLQRETDGDGWRTVVSVGFALWAAIEGAFAICVVSLLAVVAFGRPYLAQTKPFTPRPFEHEWVRFLRNVPEDPLIRDLVGKEFANLRTDEAHAELLAKKWLAE